jgi:hypothetical protein
VDEASHRAALFQGWHAAMSRRCAASSRSSTRQPAQSSLQIIGDGGHGHRVPANATAIAVPSLSPWRSVGGKQQRQERVAADLGGPDPVVADSFGRRHLIGDAGQIGAAGIVDLAADVAIHRIVRLISVNAAEIHHDDARDDYINSDYRHGVDRLAEEGDADTDDRCCADAGQGGAHGSRVARADRPRR